MGQRLHARPCKRVGTGVFLSALGETHSGHFFQNLFQIVTDAIGEDQRGLLRVRDDAVGTGAAEVDRQELVEAARHRQNENGRGGRLGQGAEGQGYRRKEKLHGSIMARVGVRRTP